MKIPVHLVAPAVGAAAILMWRLRETCKPLTTARIVAPPLAMSTGLGMFFFEPFRVPWSWALATLAAGAVLMAWPMIVTSELIEREGKIYLQRGRSFLWVLVGLLLFRQVLKVQVGHYVTLGQTSALFYLLALGMIWRWRLHMWRRFRSWTCSD